MTTAAQKKQPPSDQSCVYVAQARRLEDGRSSLSRTAVSEVTGLVGFGVVHRSYHDRLVRWPVGVESRLIT